MTAEQFLRGAQLRVVTVGGWLCSVTYRAGRLTMTGAAGGVKEADA
jgi:hypothetical protein